MTLCPGTYRLARRSVLPVAALWLAQTFAVAQVASADDFTETYVAKGPNGLRMKLQLVKPLSEVPASGWINSTDGAQSDGEFGGSVDRPMKMVTKPSPSVLEVEKRGAFSGARYQVENGRLTVCMLSIPAGSHSNVLEMAKPENYTLCAQMTRKVE